MISELPKENHIIRLCCVHAIPILKIALANPVSILNIIIGVHLKRKAEVDVKIQVDINLGTTQISRKARFINVSRLSYANANFLSPQKKINWPHFLSTFYLFDRPIPVPSCCASEWWFSMHWCDSRVLISEMQIGLLHRNSRPQKLLFIAHELIILTFCTQIPGPLFLDNCLLMNITQIRYWMEAVMDLFLFGQFNS